ncbi:MAG: hypothetical protein PHI66_01275 [Candidatus Pacebacteria bacterium]|nr:hypothetical protein [Candidatus Paceibacterota bacterium]
MDIQNFVGSLNFTASGWDLFVFVFFIIGTGFCVLRFGRDRSFIALLGVYISLALADRVELFENISGLGISGSFSGMAMFFLVAVFISFFFLSRSPFTSVFNRGQAGSWFQSLVISFLGIGLFVSMVLSFLSVNEINNLSIFLRSSFVEEKARLFWLISPLLAIFLLKEK